MAIVESLSRARRRGTGIDGGTVRLSAPCSAITVRAKIDLADKIEGNSYRVSVYRSDDNGVTWQPIVRGAEHSSLGLKERVANKPLMRAKRQEYVAADESRKNRKLTADDFAVIQAEYSKAGGTIEHVERPVALRIEWDRPQPAGTLFAATFDAPNELGIALEIEAHGAAAEKETLRTREGRR